MVIVMDRNRFCVQIGLKSLNVNGEKNGSAITVLKGRKHRNIYDITFIWMDFVRRFIPFHSTHTFSVQKKREGKQTLKNIIKTNLIPQNTVQMGKVLIFLSINFHRCRLLLHSTLSQFISIISMLATFYF